MTGKEPFIKVDNLKKYFSARYGLLSRHIVKAVDNISFTIRKGETMGLVGESGCGKSTAGRTIIRLYEPTDGKIYFDGIDITNLKEKSLRPYRKRMQMIFQDPYASLNGKMTVKDIVGEALDIHNLSSSENERTEMIYKQLLQVGLLPKHADRYPHEFSGGQRQRIGTARTLAICPEFIVCDEPVSSLDVSIQAQVINLLEDLKEKLGLTYLFIAHDLSIVRYISDKVGVMYMGKLVEMADSETIYKTPAHPYTNALLSAIPVSCSDKIGTDNRIILNGEISGSANLASGCRFHPRCRYASIRCVEEEPEMRQIGLEHYVACNNL